MTSAKIEFQSMGNRAACLSPGWSFFPVSAAPKGGALWPVLRLLLLMLIAFPATGPIRPAMAIDDREIMFLGHPILPRSGTYLVTKDVNVRAEPDTKGKKVGRFEAGSRVQIAGKAKGSWMAVRNSDRDYGFIYAPVLVPLLADAAKAPMSGKAAFAGGSCDYKIVYDGDTSIEGQEFSSFDYQVTFECRHEDKSFSFAAPMFISEGPYNGGRKPIHQIGIDVLELAQDYDRFFSTNLLYDRDKSQVRFDSISVKKYKVKKTPDPRPAANATEAVRFGIGLVLESWSPLFWQDLAGALKAASAR